MPEEGDIATVTEILPKGMVRVRCSNGGILRAGVGTSAKHGMVRLMVGDQVQLKISPYDSQRAQITRKV